jgi:tetratricopeptide (TPR) repeat protein
LFRALAVFRGGFTSAAAEAVAGASPADLRGLIDKSLLRRDASGRYVFHQLVRQYAAEQLAASPDSSAAHERHTGYYAGLLSDAASDLKGARQAESLRAVDADIDNVRAAWQWMVTNRSGALIARALDGLCLFYDLRGWLAEARMTLDLAVKTLKTDPAAAGRSTRDREIVMGRLLGWQARFEMIRGRFERSQVLVDESLAQLGRATAEHALAYGLDTRGMNANARGRQDEAAVLQQAALAAAESTDDRLGVSLAFNRLGGIAFDTGDFPQAKARFEQSLAVRREIGDWQGVARDYSNLGEVARLIGDFAEAHHRLRDSVALFRELGSNWRIVLPLENLGELSIVEGRLDDAEQHFRGALAIVRDIDEQRHLVLGTLGLGRVAWQRGDMQSAHQHLTESLAHARANGIRQGIVQCLNVRARLALGRDQMLDAERFGQESVALAAELGNHYALGVAELVLGRVALALKQFGDARRAIAASFTRLHATGARPAALDALTGLAELLMTAGARQPAGERAAELLAFVVTHPSAWHETRELAARCLDVLAVRLPEPALSASRARGAALTLDAPADAFLRSLGEAPE